MENQVQELIIPLPAMFFTVSRSFCSKVKLEFRDCSILWLLALFLSVVHVNIIIEVMRSAEIVTAMRSSTKVKPSEELKDESRHSERGLSDFCLRFILYLD
jgi:hypothetical protein